MSRLHRPLKILLLAIALAGVGLLSGCAHHDNDKPWMHKPEHKWWQGEMDSEERAFFLETFVNH